MRWGWVGRAGDRPTGWAGILRGGTVDIYPQQGGSFARGQAISRTAPAMGHPSGPDGSRGRRRGIGAVASIYTGRGRSDGRRGGDASAAPPGGTRCGGMEMGVSEMGTGRVGDGSRARGGCKPGVGWVEPGCVGIRSAPGHRGIPGAPGIPRRPCTRAPAPSRLPPPRPRSPPRTRRGPLSGGPQDGRTPPSTRLTAPRAPHG